MLKQWESSYVLIFSEWFSWSKMVRKSLLKIAFTWGFCHLMPFQTAAEAKQLIKKHAMHVASCFLSTNAAPVQLTAEIHRSLGAAPFSFRTLRYSYTNSIRIEIDLETDIGCFHQPESLQRNYSPVKSKPKPFSGQQLGHSFMAMCSSSHHW